MSKDQDILILEASLDDLRLSHALIDGGRVKFLDARSFHSRENRGEKSVLQNQEILGALAEYVSQHGLAGKDLLCLLGGSPVSCQYFDMPPLKGSSLRQAVLLKLGQHLHFDVNDALVDICPLKSEKSGDSDQLHVAVTAIRREVVRAAMEACKRLKLNTLSVSAAPAALTALAKSAIDDTGQMQAVLHVGEQTSTLIVFQGNTPCVTSEIEIGLRDFTVALMRPIIDGDNVIQLDEAKATSLRDEIGIPQVGQQIESLGVTGSRLLPLLEPILQKLSHQLTQWLTFAATCTGGQRVSRLKLVGPGAAITGLSKAIGSRVGIDVDKANWLEGLAACSTQDGDLSLSSCAVAAGAVIHRRNLPDLTPSEVRNDRRLRRIRRSTVLVGPVVAMGIFGVGLLFDTVAAKVKPSTGIDQERLAQLQRIVRAHDKRNIEQQTVQQLQQEFDEFAHATPRWDGLFKELSRILPRELKVTEFRARTEDGGILMTMQVRIYTTAQGRNFDEVVEQTLMTLERSPFFKRVQSLGSNRLSPDSPDRAAGTLFVEVELAYPRPGTRT